MGRPTMHDPKATDRAFGSRDEGRLLDVLIRAGLILALAMVAAIGGDILKFVAAFIIAGIVMAFGEAGDRASRAIFGRVVDPERGDEFTVLSVATIRAVAQGVIGITFIQAILVGLCLLLAGVPLAGALALVVLVLGIAQVPALIVTLPAIAYLWMRGGYGTVEAVVYSVLLFVAGMADNVLKPLMLGRGVDAPMPVILLGALGGMATAGILGLFVGARAGLPDLHGLGRGQPGRATAGRRRQRDRGGMSPLRPMAARRGLVSLAVPAGMLLSACTTLGPDFRSPPVPWLQGWSGGAWRSLADEAPRTTRPPGDEWWRHFDDPVLDQLVTEAQRLNPGVRTAGIRIMEARAQLGIAGSALYPQLQQVSARALGTGNRGSNGQGTTFGSAGLAFDLAWELDFWGKFKRAIESADAAYFASVAQYDDVQVLVAAQAASLYGSIRTTELRLRIAHENAAIQARSLEITERLFRSGNDSELDVQQARSQYLSTLATIPELESGLRQTRNALCVLLARPPDALPELQQGRARIPEAPLEVIVDVPAELLRRRPDVRAAEMQLAAQSPQIGISEAALYPSIALAGSVGLSATTVGSPGATLAWGLGPALVWNVFDHGRLTNQVLVQDARFQQLYEQYQDVVLRAARELDDAASGFAYTRAQVDILRDAVQAARRSLDIATVQYREGLVDFQRVLDSQRALFSTQEGLVASQGGVVQYLIAVYKAMGGGWQAGRSRPVLDDATQATMGERSAWRALLQAPLPPPSAELLPSSTSQEP